MRDDSSEGPEPDAVVVRITDDALFQCPFVLMEDAGTVRFSPLEVARLQDYLLKGGFLLASDYHGSWAQQQFDDEIARVLQPGRYPIIDLTPPLRGDHPIWHTMFNVTQLPQMASINTWRRTGDVIERWNENGAPPDARGIADEQGRLMVLMVHNTDLPDPWEREGEDKDYFYRFSPDAYARGHQYPALCHDALIGRDQEFRESVNGINDQSDRPLNCAHRAQRERGDRQRRIRRARTSGTRRCRAGTGSDGRATRWSRFTTDCFGSVPIRYVPITWPDDTMSGASWISVAFSAAAISRKMRRPCSSARFE